MAHSLGRKTVRWQLEEDMDQRVADARSTSDERAAVQLCDLALSKVDPDLAEVFVMFELEGLSSPEIAASLEIPLGTVASRLRRAREQFRVVVGRLELTMRREGAPRDAARLRSSRPSCASSVPPTSSGASSTPPRASCRPSS